MSITAELARVAAATPDALALVDRDRELTFRGLVSELDRIAGGLGPLPRGARVAVLAERHWTTVAGALGVLHAGGAYLPLSPADPPSRLRSAVAAAGATAVLGRAASLAALPDLGVPALPFEDLSGTGGATTGPQDLAYLMYTSGSTGAPKGVLVPHRAVLAAGTSLRARYGIVPSDRVLNLTSLIWDTSGEEIYPTLFGGAAVVTDERTAQASIDTLFAVVAERRVTVINLATALWNEMADHVLTTGTTPPPCLRLVVIGGEEARARTVRQWCERVDAELINAYGQTETVMVTHAADIGGAVGRALHDDDVVPIGHSLPHIEEVLTPRDNDTAELRIGGPTVAWGYHDRPDLTADRFVPSPRGRLYRTGDLVRTGPGGLTFVGRVDRQVKIRGVRVEPAEVERAMMRCPGVAAVAVFAVGDEHPNLIGVYVPSETTPAAPDEVIAHLRAHLPPALLPHRVARRAALPLTATGKVDRSALHDLYRPDTVAARDDDGTTVDLVTAAYQEVLGAPTDPDSSYFELGGDSLLAVRLISRLHQRTATRITVRDVFEHPTPRLLAKRLESG